jgi:hypothetical protein
LGILGSGEYDAVKKMAHRESVAVRPEKNLGISCYNFTTDLSRGSDGAVVLRLATWSGAFAGPTTATRPERIVFLPYQPKVVVVIAPYVGMRGVRLKICVQPRQDGPLKKSPRNVEVNLNTLLRQHRPSSLNEIRCTPVRRFARPNAEGNRGEHHRRCTDLDKRSWIACSGYVFEIISDAGFR